MQKVISITATTLMKRDFYLNALSSFVEENSSKIVMKNFFDFLSSKRIEEVLTLSQLNKQEEAFDILRESYNEVIRKITCRTVASVILLQPSPFDLACWFPSYAIFGKKWGLSYMSENDLRFNLDYLVYFSDRPDYRHMFTNLKGELNTIYLKAYFQRHLRLRKSNKDYGFKVININNGDKLKSFKKFLLSLMNEEASCCR